MNDWIDLHAHSTASDGTLSPTELARLGKEIGLRALALTDHDTAAGLPEFLAETARLGLEAVPGMETTLHVEDCDVHLVCLYFDWEQPEMAAALRDMDASRSERNEEMVKKLAELGFPISMEQLRQSCTGEISRGHMARILMEAGYAETTKEAIRRYLSPGAPAYVRRRTPDPAALIRTVHRAGGLCFVAHLHQIDPADEQHCLSIARKLLETGADGVETLYSEYDGHWRTMTEALIQEFHALRSGGSDFHGSIKPGLQLGSGYGDLRVPYRFLQAIKDARGGRL